MPYYTPDMTRHIRTYDEVVKKVNKPLSKKEPTGTEKEETKNRVLKIKTQMCTSFIVLGI